MTARIGHVDGEIIRLEGETTWKTGQAVLVIPLVALGARGEAPPTDLLAEDAVEFAPRRKALEAANEVDLE